MSDIKISALPGASTLTGAESIPVVQGGVTKKVTTDQFLTKDASGNVGVGTASPSAKLEVVGGFRQKAVAGNANGFNITIDSGTDAVTLSNYYNAPLIFGQNNSEIARFSAGNLGLGVTPSAWGSYYKAIESTTASEFCITSQNNGIEIGRGYYKINAGFGSVYTTGQAPSKYYQDGSGGHNWYTAPSGTAGNPISFTQAMTLDASGNLGLGSADPGRTAAGRVVLGINGSSSALLNFRQGGVDAGYIFASATAMEIAKDGAYPILLTTNGAERARIDASGNLLVGTTSASGRFTVRQDSDTESPIYVVNAAISGKFASFEGNGAVRGSITWSGSTTSFNTSSDARLKENISDAHNGSALIDGLQVRKFDWKSDGSHQRFGFVAQELDAVYPEAVSKPADPDEMMGVDYSKLVPLLVQEIQSLRARVAALETV